MAAKRLKNCSVIFLLCVIAQHKFASCYGMSCSAEKTKMVQDFEKTLMSCAMHSVDFSLMEKIIENINHLENLLTMEFICGFQKDFAKLADCMVHKYAECLPPAVKGMIIPLLPNESGWEKIIKFGCDNRKVLSKQCMTAESSHQFLNCYKGKLQENVFALTSATSSKDINSLLCSVRQWDQQCLVNHAGACSADYVQLVNKLVTMVLHQPNCDTVSEADTKMGSALSSILLKGHPLLFKAHSDTEKNINHHIP